MMAIVALWLLSGWMLLLVVLYPSMMKWRLLPSTSFLDVRLLPLPLLLSVLLLLLLIIVPPAATAAAVLSSSAAAALFLCCRWWGGAAAERRAPAWSYRPSSSTFQPRR